MGIIQMDNVEDERNCYDYHNTICKNTRFLSSDYGAKLPWRVNPGCIVNVRVREADWIPPVHPVNT